MAQKNQNQNQNRGNQRQVKINSDAKDFARASWKKFKKKNKGMFDGKKEMKEGFIMDLIDMLPGTIDFVIRCGYIKDDEVQETKNAIYAKLVDPDFIKVLKKDIKNGNRVDKLELLPIIIKEILMETDKTNRENLAKDPQCQVYDMSDLVELSSVILKKRLKKFNKANIEQKLAFDLLSVVPTDESIRISQTYRIHTLFEVMYEHSKTEEIPFKEIMKVLVDEDYYPVFITYALLERKEKFSGLTEQQKAFYLKVSEWIFATTETLSKEEITAIINAYVRGRKRDESQGRDCNRRYYLGSLCKDDYPRLTKVIDKLVADDDTIKKYL